MEYEGLGDTAGLSSRKICTVIDCVDGRDVWHWLHSLSGVLGTNRGLQETDTDRDTKIDRYMPADAVLLLFKVVRDKLAESLLQEDYKIKRVGISTEWAQS